MIATSTRSSQAEFFRAFLMARGKFDPKDFGVEMERDEFVDLLVEEFGASYYGQWTVDELVLHPREAMNFCDTVRRKMGWLLVPDDIILRPLMNRRKNP